MIRKYEDKEIPQLMHIWKTSSSLAHPFLTDAFVETVTQAMREMYLPNSDTSVYVKNNTIIGFISMLDNEIAGLFVLPDHHSKGIGTALVKHIRQFHPTLEVEVFTNNKIGLPFYKKLGFEMIKEYFHEEAKQNILRLKLHTKILI